MDSELVVRKDGTISAYCGPDATNYFRAKVLVSGMKMYLVSKGKIMPTRGLTITRMLVLAAGFTGKPYKRTEVEKAIADVTLWAVNMEAALPVVQGD